MAMVSVQIGVAVASMNTTMVQEIVVLITMVDQGTLGLIGDTGGVGDMGGGISPIRTLTSNIPIPRMAGLEAAHKVCTTMVVTSPCVVSHNMEAAFITRTDMALLLLREGRFSKPLRLLGVDLMPPGLEALSMPRSPPTCRGVGQGAPISQGEPGGLSVPPGSHPPPPPQEVGVGQRGGTTTNQVTEMAVDLSSTKLPLAANSSVPPTDQQGTSIDVPESFVKGSQKSKGKPYCWRCRTKGHTIHECSIVLCCELCFGDHVTKVCPYNKKSPATSAIPCGYAVEGLGFYFIPTAANPRVNVHETRAVVRVLEGSFSVNQLAVELEKFRPDKNHKWDI